GGGGGAAGTDIGRRDVPATAQALAAAGIDPVLARVYAARGVASAAELETDLARLPSYTQLKGIDGAAARLAGAIAQRERIVVVASYDAYGSDACAVAVRGL